MTSSFKVKDSPMRMIFGLLLTASLLSLHAISTGAEEANCTSHAVFQYRDQADISNLVQNVLAIEGSDRLRQNEYAKKNGLTSGQAEAMFGATGALNCDPLPGKITGGSANVVGRRDVLATSAHIFWDQDSCEPLALPENCSFMTVVDGKEVSYKVKGILSTGFKCPDHFPNEKDDWAILDLEKEVSSKIEPYKLGDADSMNKGDPVLAVNGQNADFFEKSPNTGKVRLAKSLAPCEWGELVDQRISTSCSAAGGSSGSALLNRQRELVAIADSSTESTKDLETALTTKPFKANSCAYDKFTCATRYIPIESDFRRALTSAIAGISL